MLLRRRLSIKELAEWCRSISQSLRSGIPLVKTLANASQRGTPRMREASANVYQSLERGTETSRAVASGAAYFPPLVVSMTKVGVETGHLPEVLRELEKYYRMQLSLRQKLIQQITWPMFQLIMAIGVIALVIYLLGILPAADVLGLGLRGPTGAMIWLGGWAVMVVAGVGGYWLARNKFGKAQAIDNVILRIPVLGQVARSLAISRLSMAMSLTMDSGMPLKRAIPLSLTASDNAVFESLAKSMQQSIRDGEALSEAFRQHALFPDEMIDVLQTAEDSGRIPEAMKQYSADLSQRVEHQMYLLNQALGWLVWLIVAAIIIFFIMRIAMVAYIGPMYDALDQLPG